MTTQIDKLTGNCKEFAVACFDTNSISELENAKFDATDAKKWNLTRAEWERAVGAALADKSELSS